MSTRGNATYDLDRLARAEDELSLALRSLDDLEAEHASGQVSDATYTKLHAAYTVRAADAARTRRELSRRKPTVAARSRRTWVVVAAVLVVLLAGVGVALRMGSNPRPPGATITGDSTSTTADVGRGTNPDAQAEQQLVKGDLSGALRSYIDVLRTNPRDVEALSYGGWLSLLAGAPKQATPMLRAAVRTDPSYPDGHAFLGIVLLRSHQHTALAKAQLRTYLRLVPSGQMSGQVRRVLQVAGRQTRTGGGAPGR